MGVQFTQEVSGFPLRCLFRGSMLRGRYPHHCVVGHEYPLPEGQATITEPLKQAGYSVKNDSLRLAALGCLKVIMLEGGSHTGDLRFSDSEPGGLLAP